MARQNLSQLFFFTHTPLHVDQGTAPSIGLLPRDVTNTPSIPASTVHGTIRAELRRALRAKEPSESVTACRALFGLDASEPRHENAAVKVTDAAILCIPLRTVRGHFVWLASQELLTNLATSLTETLSQSAPGAAAPFAVPTIEGSSLVCGKECFFPEQKPGSPGNFELQVEEFTLPIKADPIVDSIANWLSTFALPQTPGTEWWREKFRHSLIVAPHALFVNLVNSALPITAKATLRDDGGESSAEISGTIEQLTTREFLPADAVLSSTLFREEGFRENGSATDVQTREILKHLPLSVVQIGAERGTGNGVAYCRMLL
jgi:CRISPR-associated protein Cmr4